MQASRQTQKLLCLSLPNHRSDWSEVNFDSTVSWNFFLYWYLL